MALQVDYLSKIGQFSGTDRQEPTLVRKDSYLVNKSQALDWMAAQIAVIIGFEDGRLSEAELDGQALAFAKAGCQKSGTKIDFIDKVGDKLGALRPEKSKRVQIDESLEAVWFPKHMFEKFGGDVFELDAEGDNKSHAKVSVRERRVDKRTEQPQDLTAEDERQVELAAALRWAAAITS